MTNVTHDTLHRLFHMHDFSWMVSRCCCLVGANAALPFVICASQWHAQAERHPNLFVQVPNLHSAATQRFPCCGYAICSKTQARDTLHQLITAFKPAYAGHPDAVKTRACHNVHKIQHFTSIVHRPKDLVLEMRYKPSCDKSF